MADIFDLFKKIETAAPSALPSVSWLLAGLGNPGMEYLHTRHNVGFGAVDVLAAACGVRIDRAKYHALIAETVIAGTRVLLMKPQTYMNNSGTAIAEAANFYKVQPAHILVFSDDISLSPGRLRVRAKGSAGGHNGLKSIIEQLGSDAFPRIKIGVGEKPSPDYDLADWVLGKLPPADSDKIDERNKDILAGVEAILQGDIDRAARICNGK